MTKITLKSFVLFTASVLLASNAFALGRTHEYTIFVVKKDGTPAPGMFIETKSVSGYDQKHESCITTANGRCTLNFSAFAPQNTYVLITIRNKDSANGYSMEHTLKPIESSFFKNDDSSEQIVTFDDEKAMRIERENSERAEAKKRAADEMAAREKLAEERYAKERIAALDELLKLERNATLQCTTKAACDKAFALTEIFFAQHSDMKIQTATGTTIETFNPTEEFKIGLKALKIPGKGSAAAIRLTVTCKETYISMYCIHMKSSVYRSFRSYMSTSLAE